MRVGITFSSLGLLRSEHLIMLKEAKKKCDYLIVGLQLYPSIENFDKKVSAQSSIIKKYIQLKRLKFVDEIIPYVSEQDIEDVLRSFKIDVLIKRDDYEAVNFTGKEYCKEKRIEIYYYPTQRKSYN